ncbi:MAG: hypothetical protein ACT4P7_08180, partial [Gemmatimonadaceae bacterium]
MLIFQQCGPFVKGGGSAYDGCRAHLRKLERLRPDGLGVVYSGQGIDLTPWDRVAPPNAVCTDDLARTATKP